MVDCVRHLTAESVGTLEGASFSRRFGGRGRVFMKRPTELTTRRMVKVEDTLSKGRGSPSIRLRVVGGSIVAKSRNAHE